MKMNHYLHKRLLIFGALITILPLPLLVILEVDSYSFFDHIFKLDTDKSIVCSSFVVGIFLMGIAFILKVFKKA